MIMVINIITLEEKKFFLNTSNNKRFDFIRDLTSLEFKSYLLKIESKESEKVK